ncbi:MAG TPA: TolC family protein [Candidatus Dormibacteraeota bacterium]|nr:TolC family protein [Candidatus Dormibacteraeota bacterium]
MRRLTMGVRMVQRLLLASAICLAAAWAWAEDPLNGDATREYILEDVPNFPTILKDQWSSRVPTTPFDGGRSNYGLLSEAEPEREVTLAESIALALEHNTGLRISALNPIAATNLVRKAYSQFDPELYGNTSKQRTNTPVQTISPFTSADQFANSSDLSLFSDQVDWNAGVRKRLLTGGILSGEWDNAQLSSNPTVVNLVNPDYVTTLNLSLSQPLLRDFGWRFALLVVDVAQIGEEQAFQIYKAQVAGLIENVERAYWTYVLAIENVRVEVKGLDLAKELLRQNQSRFNVGSLPRTAVLESEAEVARREADLVTATALERVARDNLRALVNARQNDEDVLIMIEPADKPAVTMTDFNLDDSLRVGYEKRPELLAARLNVDGRQVDRKIAENRLLPRLDLVASIGLNGLGGTDAGLIQPTPGVTPGQPTPVPSTFQFLPNPQVLGGYSRSLELLTDGRYYQYLVGAQLVIPIDNASAKADYAQAKVNAEAARLDLRQTEENVTLEITQTVNNLKASLRRIEATRVASELAEENVRNQQARYDVGLATTKDLIDFQDRLTQAQREEITALTTYNILLAQLYFSEGTLLDRRNVMLARNVPESAPWWARF